MDLEKHAFVDGQPNRLLNEIVMIEDSSIKSLEKEFRRNYSKFFTLAFRMSGNRDDAEDILQNSFLNALKGIGNFREESSLYTWLYRIVLNCSKRYGRDDLRFKFIHAHYELLVYLLSFRAE